MTEERETSRKNIQKAYEALENVYPHTLNEADWHLFITARKALEDMSFTED